MKTKPRSAANLLEYLNATYLRLHSSYEKAFWLSYMGDRSYAEKKNKTEVARDAFRADPKLAGEIDEAIKVQKSKGSKSMSLIGGKLKGSARGKTKSGALHSSDKTLARLLIWKRFFGLYQTPVEALPIKERVGELENKAQHIRSTRKEGYVDPVSGSFVEASENKMRTIMRTHPDEAVRKACYESMEKMTYDTLDLFVEIVKGRNEFARMLGYQDFYDYKIHIDEGMTKKELFSIFDVIYDKTKYAFDDVRRLEKKMEKDGKPGLRKPWNFAYMMTGDFTKEEDPYFQFEDALLYWGRSFAAVGAGFAGGSVTLDLLDRKGKYNNGFCHWPVPVHYEKVGGKTVRVSGSSNFTSTAIPGQVGSGAQGINTLFHEGGHACHYLNSRQEDICLNTEYPPSTVSWAETQSMFMDSISDSIEWRTRYAKNAAGEPYPFELFERKLRAVHALRPLSLMGIIHVVFFEKEIYECKNITADFIVATAKKVSKKYFDRSEDSVSILNIPHIYSWESSAYYHGYGLAELGVEQWREYFYKKYGHFVDNANVGKEMKKVWELASLHTSNQFMKMATGKPLSGQAFVANVTKPLEAVLKTAKEKIARLEKVPMLNKPVNLDGTITLVHGKEKIADNKKSFEDMEQKYRKWLARMK